MTDTVTDDLRRRLQAQLGAAYELERAHAAGDCEIAWWAAHCLAAVGERDEAVAWLRTAIDGGFLSHRS